MNASKNLKLTDLLLKNRNGKGFKIMGVGDRTGSSEYDETCTLIIRGFEDVKNPFAMFNRKAAKYILDVILKNQGGYVSFALDGDQVFVAIEKERKCPGYRLTINKSAPETFHSFNAKKLIRQLKMSAGIYELRVNPNDDEICIKYDMIWYPLIKIQ